VLKAISAKAPQAQIVLMGYPKIMQDTVGSCLSIHISNNFATAMDQLGDYLAQKQRATVDALAATGVKVAYADPAGVFGGHGICGVTSWFHEFTFGPDGDGDFHAGDANSPLCILVDAACLSRESFHPTGGGSGGFAQVLHDELVSIHYHGS
jgi:hypothetical protein